MGSTLDLFSNKQKQKKQRTGNADFNDFRESRKGFSNLLFSKGRISSKFYTEDSGLYITPKQSEMLSMGEKLNANYGSSDGLGHRIASKYKKINPSKSSILYWRYRRSLRIIDEINDKMKDQAKGFVGKTSLIKMWNTSIVFSMICGMFFMSLIYRYLGQSAAANESINNAAQAQERTIDEYAQQKENEKAEEVGNEKEDDYIKGVTAFLQEEDQKIFEKKVREMVKGYPIEDMLPYIFKQDRTTATFLIAIAKKESNWGKRVPVLDGNDCFNYWGYRGIRDRMGTGGHTCFNGPEDAVSTVAKRVSWFVNEKKLDTPEELIVWKCGNSCAAHSSYSVKKWISDVDMYFDELN